MEIFIRNLESTALAGRNINLSYKQLLGNISRFAALLKGRGGQRVAIFSENRPEWIYALYAIWKKNSIAVPIDALSTPHDVTHILLDCRPDVLFCSSEKHPVILEALKESHADTEILVFEDISMCDAIEAEDMVIADPDRTALILYTSGTTGGPKGVMLSFTNMITNLHAVCHDVRIFTPADRVMILLPLHHILPLLGTIVAPLYVGATMVLNTSLNAEDLISTMKRFGVTIMIGVPRLYRLIYKGLKEKITQNLAARIMLRLSRIINSMAFSRILFRTVHVKFGGHIRYLVCGGAPIDPEVVSFFIHLGFEFLEGYGMTETAPMITFTRPGSVKPGIPGQLLPGIGIRFLEGEILVSGGNVMQGYYNRPAETSEVLKEGWLHTGDLGFMDEKGYLHITGRKKEIIVMPNGKNINPEELEQALIRQSDFIRESGVFLKDGVLQAILVPDLKKLGESGILEPEEYLKMEVVDRVNRSLSTYKKILRVHISSSELPKTQLGKIKRYLLPGLAMEKKQKEQPEPDIREYAIIRKFLEEETQQPVSPSDHLELDLALDSLARVSLSAFIDTAFGVGIPDNGFSDFRSVSQLAEYIHRCKTRMNPEGISWSQILKEKVHVNLPSSLFTHNLLKNLIQAFLSSFVRIRARGHENLPDDSCIIAPNHQSILDGFLVAGQLKRKFIKKTYVYAKEKHFRGPLMKFLAERNNIILVDINKDLKLSIQKLAEVLKKGKNLIIFPEGTRSLNGKMGDFKQTFAILSRELNVPVVPVAIKGSYDVLPSGSRFPRLFRKVYVEFLEPVHPGDGSYESLKNRVYERLAMHLGED